MIATDLVFVLATMLYALCAIDRATAGFFSPAYLSYAEKVRVQSFPSPITLDMLLSKSTGAELECQSRVECFEICCTGEVPIS